MHRLHEALRNPFSDRDDDYVVVHLTGVNGWKSAARVKGYLLTAACQPEFYGADILARHDHNQFAIRT